MKKLFYNIKNMFAISFWDSIYKIFLFKDLFRTTIPFVQRIYIKKSQKKQKNTLEKIKSKPVITVAFFLQTPSTWKYDKLYRLFEKSERFKPIVVICPFNIHLNYSKNEMMLVMKKTEEFAKNQNYNYILTFDKQNKKWLNIRKIINPDIVFFTKPYKDTLPQYYIYQFRDKITCYTPYAFICLNIYQLNYGLPLFNLLKYFFVETDFQKQFAQKYLLIKGENAVITGYLGTEPLIDGHKPDDIWKKQDKLKKRIIWAPHHTIDYLFNFSNFLIYCDLMLDLAKKYEDKIQFVFKPHPVLKFKLINLWGEEKTNQYYEKWQNLPNTQIEEGYYIDLFLASDAMIHDCASFTAEYLLTLKPVCFMVRDKKNVQKQWNPFGEKAFNLHYQAHNKEEIESFINNVVLAENDTMYDSRKAFYDEYLYPKDGVMPSEKILKVLENDISD